MVNKVDTNVIRVNIRMSNEIKKWYEQKANEMGIPYSAYMVFALREYMKQDEGLNSFKAAMSLKDSLTGPGGLSLNSITDYIDK